MYDCTSALIEAGSTRQRYRTAQPQRGHGGLGFVTPGRCHTLVSFTLDACEIPVAPGRVMRLHDGMNRTAGLLPERAIHGLGGA